MRLLHRYILESMVVTFAITLVVVTFIMCLGAILQMSDFLARGVPLRPIAIIFLSAVPMVLAFSIPISSMTACLLVFERMSGDGEIAAMRACGISIWQIISRPVLWALFLTSICLYINTELVSKMHYVHRKTLFEYRHMLAASIWEAGEFVRDVPGLTIYVGRSRYDRTAGTHEIGDIIIYDSRAGNVEREIRARSGLVETAPDGGQVKIALRDVRIDPLVLERPGFALLDSYTVTIDTSSLRNEYRVRMADRSAGELIEGIVGAGNVSARTSQAVRVSFGVELNQRIVLSLSCLAFVLLGIPFGISTRRSSSTVGIAISLLVVFSFYLFILLVDSLAKRPETRPDLIIWTPAIASVLLGLILLRRIR